MTRKQDLQDRLQRAQSWIKAAGESSSDQDHERFIFYYVALNAMYGRRQYEGNRSDVWQDIDRFVNQVKQMCASTGERNGKVLLPALQNTHVDALILDYFLLDDLFKGATREKLVGRCKRDLTEAKLKLRSGDPFTMLRAILRRLTVLRNRVMHGCVTYGAVSKGVAFRNQGSARRSRSGAGLVRADGLSWSWREVGPDPVPTRGNRRPPGQTRCGVRAPPLYPGITQEVASNESQRDPKPLTQ
jgi:hypothetical protein